MLYSPLIPSSDSLVEVGQSEIVTLYGEDEAEDRAYRAELRRRWADGRGFVSFEALSETGRVDEEDRIIGERARKMSNALHIDLGDDSESAENSHGGQNGDRNEAVGRDATPKPRERVVWKPSPTQISVQVLWWGYRMYVSSQFFHSNFFITQI